MKLGFCKLAGFLFVTDYAGIVFRRYKDGLLPSKLEKRYLN